MAAIISTTDLPASIRTTEMAAMMVAGANAKASRVAPCLTWDGTDATKPAPTVDMLAEAKLILVGAVQRWVDTGAGALQQQSAGPFSQTVDTRRPGGWNLWPSEIAQLQDICNAGKDTAAGAFSISLGGSAITHMPWCAINLGANYCSCGADIARYPLYEGADTDFY